MIAPRCVEAHAARTGRSRLPWLLELLKYFVCSAAALAADVAVYAALLRFHAGYAAAAAAGFAVGLVVAYTLSVRVVFADRSLADERLEFAIFAAIGCVGVLLTELLLWWFVERCGVPPVPAKLATAAAVFLFNFGARKALLFSRDRRPVLA